MSRRETRRGLLGLLGSATAALAGCSARDGSASAGWTAVSTPTTSALYSATTTQRGPCAVGEDGRLLGRSDGDWRVELDAGPSGAHRDLTGVDSTADGRRAWFCGDGGVVGRYDFDADRVTDFSAPTGATSAWTDVAVAGLAGQEWLFLVNGSGELLQGRHDGSGVSWRGLVKPGGGSSMPGVSFVDRGTGYVCDTAGNVYQTVDAGRDWRRIGVDGASVNFYDVARRGPDDVTVAAGSGTVFRYDGFSWTAVSVGEADVRGLARDRYTGLVVDGAGGVHELTRNGWLARDVPVEIPLHDVVLGTVEVPDVAVGSDGTVLERQR